jgi:LPXTG-motif cell wall-anchored protein
VPVRPQVLAASAVLIALALPGVAVAQSAGDEQYTDPFGQGDAPAQQEPAPEQPVEQTPSTPEPPPGGNGAVEAAPTAEAAPESSPSLPRTGTPVVLFAAIGYALLLAGIAIRRKS